MEFILGIKDTLSSFSRPFFIVALFMAVVPESNFFLDLMPFASWMLIIFFAIELIELLIGIIKTIAGFITGEPKIIDLISNILEVLLLIVGIIIFFVSKEDLDMSSLIPSADNSIWLDNPTLAPAILASIIIIFRSWVLEIISLPLSLIGVFFGEDDF